MDISFINNDKLSDKEKKVKLQQIKYNLQRNLNILEKELEKLSNKIINECDHEFIIEREDGMYGERWKTCKHCDYFIRY